MGCLSKSMEKEIIIGFGLRIDDLGEGPRKQRSALDEMLSESGGNPMIGHFVRGTVTLILSVLRQYYEVTLFCFILLRSQSNFI